MRLAGIAWTWLLSSTGLVNQLLSAVGLGAVTRAWLGDSSTALPAVGVIGAWVLLGLCTLLLLAGLSKIDPALYEAARIDGAGPFREFRSITAPSLRHEIGVCVTVTMIAALASFGRAFSLFQSQRGSLGASADDAAPYFDLLLAKIASDPAKADDYPSHPVKIIVPFGAGGLTDVYTRVIAEELQLPIYATRGTAEILAGLGIACTTVEKSDGDGGS